MILDNSNWQPSITRSIRGNSSYKFQNQLFGSDVDKLKVEISLAGKPFNQIQILPCTLTVSYTENIDDEVFSIPLGLTKPLATLISNLKPYPLRITLTNPNSTAITGTVKKLIVKRTLTSLNTEQMPVHQPTPNQDNSALIAAIQAGSQAELDAIALSRDVISQTIVAISEQVELLDMVQRDFNAKQASQLICPANLNTRSCTVSTSNTEAVYRFYRYEPASFADVNYVVELFGANAQYERPPLECQAALWMCCSIDGDGADPDVLVSEMAKQTDG